MNIVQAHKFFWYRDGASNYAWGLAELLEKRGHSSIPFSMHHPKAMESPYAKYFVSQLELDQPGSVSLMQKFQAAARIIYSREARKKMQQLLNSVPVDVVHLHNIYHHISPSILPEIKKRNIPVVMTLHDYKLIAPNYTLFHHGAVHEEDAKGWYWSTTKNKSVKNSRLQSAMLQIEMVIHHKFLKYYEKYVDKFIAPSEFIMDLCIKYGWPREKFVHIPHYAEQTKKTSAKKEGDYVAYVGRITEEKGLHTVLHAAKLSPHIPYVIVGEGPLKPELEKRVETEGIGNVTFTGFLTGTALEKQITEARLLIVPSLWYENYPLSILEPKAAGQVVIGSRIGGIPELLPSTLLVSPGDAAELDKRVNYWYDAPLEKRQKMGNTLQKETIKINNPELHLDRIESLYHQIMKKSEHTV